jgi:hypothetical protein
MGKLVPRSTQHLDFLRAHEQGGDPALVVGSRIIDDKIDRRALYPTAVGVDMIAGDGVDIVHDMEQPLQISDSVCHVDCVSVLEHVSRPWLLAANVERVMRESATIFVSVPWVWRIHGHPDDYWRYTPSALRTIFPNINWIDFAYTTDTGTVKKVPTIRDSDGAVYFARSELMAWGEKL